MEQEPEQKLEQAIADISKLVQTELESWNNGTTGTQIGTG
jgi:hypothetical protein